jgi:N-glycosylase/DNA lyase
MDITPQDRENAQMVLTNFKAKKTEIERFYSLCFALLSPQTTAKSNFKVMEELVKRGFFYKDSIDKATLLKILKPVRFYNNKTKWLLEMKNKWDEIKAYIFDTNYSSSRPRDILVECIKGLGYKTASMFLRDIGYKL